MSCVFSFDIGWKFHGWAVKNKSGIDAGVYAFENNSEKEDYSKIRRTKNRKRSKRRRLSEIKKLIVENSDFKNIKELNKFLDKRKDKNNLWQNIQKAHSQPLTQEEFILILYRFAKRRYYIDMRKKSSNKEDSEKKVIKKALSAIDEIYNSIEDSSKTYFSALFIRRKEIIEFLKEKGLPINEAKFPYTNRALDKLIKVKESELPKDFSNYELMLDNRQLAISIKKLAQIQRELDNSTKLFSKEFIDRYIELITFKGVVPSFEDKIGLCLSGNGKKRTAQSSIDAELARIATAYNLILETIDENGEIKEESFGTLGIEFNTFKNILITIAKKNKKSQVAAKALLKEIIKLKPCLKKKTIHFKNFKHKKEPLESVVIYLLGHCRLDKLSQNVQEQLLNNFEFRDKIEFAMLSNRSIETLQEKILNIAKEYNVELTDSDLEILSTSEVGKPAPCCNVVYQEITPLIIEGKDFQTALITKYPNSQINIKNYYRKTLDYEIYLQKQKINGINTPYQDKVIKEFIFLFNRLVQKYGEPDRVVIETTRAILSDSQKDEINKEIKKNEDLNKNINAILSEYEQKFSQKPSKGARVRLKLFVQQGGELKFGGKSAKCILTGNCISLEAAIEGDRTNRDHIIPQSWIHDNRLTNSMLLDASINQSQKSDMTPLQYLQNSGLSPAKAKEKLKEHIKGMKLSKLKVKYIFETKEKEEIKKESEDNIHSMDQRMKGVQDASIKLIMNLLVDQLRFNSSEKLTLAQYREKVLPVTGKMTSLFRKGWLKEYKKDRKKYHNHAVDALVMLNFDRKFLHSYIKLLQETYLTDKNPIWIPREKLSPTIKDFKETVYSIVKEFEEQSRIVVMQPTKKYSGRVFQETVYNKIEPHTVKTKNHFFMPNSGFTKLLLYKAKTTKRGKEQEVYKILKLHPAYKNIKEPQSIIGELYRNTLIYLKSKSYCGYFYIIGHSGNTLELNRANESNEKRIRPTLTSINELFIFKDTPPINGKVKKVCKE